jgi:hypothetical protein
VQTRGKSRSPGHRQEDTTLGCDRSSAQLPSQGLVWKYINDYGTAVNVICSPGEAKHKPLKAHTVQTNSKGVDLQLLKRITESQAIQFTLDGTFDASHPTINNILELIRSTIPRLFVPVAPVSRWTHRLGIDNDEIIAGGEYTGSAVSIRVLNIIEQNGSFCPPQFGFISPRTVVQGRNNYQHSEAHPSMDNNCTYSTIIAMNDMAPTLLPLFVDNAIKSPHAA